MKPYSLLLWWGAAALAGTLSAKDYATYLLAGQSNMEGYGYVAELPDGVEGRLSDAFIFHGNTAEDDAALDGRGRWSPLRAGHGVGFSSDGRSNAYSERFGPEIGFALEMRRLEPDTPIAIIKYARGGTALDAESTQNFGRWHAGYAEGRGVNQLDHCLASVAQAYAERDIDGDGETDRLIPAGILWMQGESDGVQLEPALRYRDNLSDLVAQLRAAMRVGNLPVAIGRISDSGWGEEDGLVWDFGNVVRAHQEAFCASDANAVLVTSTDGYGYSDKWHYDSDGFLDLGKQFARALSSLDSSADRD